MRRGDKNLNSNADKIAELFISYGDEILRTCMLILGNHYLAEDAAMMVYEKALSSYSGFKGHSSEKTWLIKIAINTCRDILKSHTYSRRADDVVLDSMVCENQYTKAEKRLCVSEAVMSLPDKYREAAVLCFYNGMTAKEAAKTAAVAQTTMNYRICKAKELLKKHLKEWSDEL